MRLALVSLLMIPLVSGCGSGGDDEKSDNETEECFSDEECPDGQVCVISHDHEGDDHDHGGTCEPTE